VAADPIEKSLRERDLRQPYDLDYPDWVTKLVSSGELSEADGKILIDSATATRKVIMVDDFPRDFLQSSQGVVSDRDCGGKLIVSWIQYNLVMIHQRQGFRLLPG